jgi:lipopolysaccharide export LptBFGC system permease protein LptF
MVFTLQRYIFRELFRIFLLATIGLTLIVSLGGVLQPVQEYGVGPRQVLHILLYFMPVTLTFVLPMAALFASALAYGRFASDNELNACRASGISLTTLVYPGLVLAILVATANLLLSFHVMPYFVHLAEKSFKADAKHILFRNIQRRGYYSLPPDGRFLVYADYVDEKNDTLSGIVVVEASQGVIKKIRTADGARVRFDPHDKFNEVQLDAFGVQQMGGAGDLWWRVGTASLRFEFGSLLRDSIKFKRVNEMKRIRADPMQFDPVAKLALRAYAQLATELLAQDIKGKLSGLPGGFYAASVALGGEKTIALTGPVIVEEHDSRSGQRLRRLRCEKAAIHMGEEMTNPSLTLDLYNPRVEATDQLIVRYVVRGLMSPEPVRRSLGHGSILKVVAPTHTSSVLHGPPSRMLAGLQEALQTRIDGALVDVRAEANSRLVFGIGCIPMIMIGIGLGIILRGGHLLSAFGASCVPAAVLVVAIISGKNITQNAGLEGLSGILVMWAGLAGMTVLAALLYAKLLRT